MKCKKTFFRPPSQLAKGGINFCSRQCFFSQGTSRPGVGQVKLYYFDRLIRKESFYRKHNVKKKLREWEREFSGVIGEFYAPVTFNQA